MLSCTAGAHSREIMNPEENAAGCAAVERLTGVAPDGYSAASGSAVSMQSGPEGEFTAHELLREGSAFLEELHRLILQTAELYRAGNEQEGNGHFIELTHGLEWFVKLTATVQQRPEFSAVVATCAPQPVSGLNDILGEIVAAQEHQDMVLLTDLLEYELALQVKPWLDTFSKLRDSF